MIGTRAAVILWAAVFTAAPLLSGSLDANAQEPALVVPPPATQGPPTPLPSKTALQFHVNHVALRVADLEGSVDWWRRVLGAVEVRRSRIGAINDRAEIALMHINQSFHIELIGGGEVQTPPGLPPSDIASDYKLAGWKHVGFYVADAEKLLAHLRSQNVEPAYDVMNEGYGVRIILIQDPNGYFVEFYAPIEGNRTEP